MKTYDMIEAVDEFIDELVDGVVDGIENMLSTIEEEEKNHLPARPLYPKSVHEDEAAMLESIRIALGIRSGELLPKFFNYIADEAVDKAAFRLNALGYYVERLNSAEFYVYPKKEAEAE